MVDGEAWAAASVRIMSTATSPVQITEHLGIDPSLTEWRGELVSARNPGGARRADSRWVYDSGVDDSEPPEVHLAALLDVFGTSAMAARVTSLPADCEFQIWVGLTASDSGRLHDFPAEILRAIAALNASLFVDLYERSGRRRHVFRRRRRR